MHSHFQDFNLNLILSVQYNLMFAVVKYLYFLFVKLFYCIEFYLLIWTFSQKATANNEYTEIQGILNSIYPNNTLRDNELKFVLSYFQNSINLFY